jgi:hypothetical protein
MGEKFALKFKRNAGKMRLFDGIKPRINAAISPLKISVAGQYKRVLCGFLPTFVSHEKAATGR